MKELLKSSTDSALSVQNGDLEIANNQLKMSAWLATIATAGLYFCFSGSNENYIYLSDFFYLPIFYPYIFISLIFGLSLVAAYKFHNIYNHFSAISRNAICGYNIQLSAGLQALEVTEFVKKLAEVDAPIWSLVVTGEIWKMVYEDNDNIINDTLAKIEIYRTRVELVSIIQKVLTLAGFILLIIANAYFSMI